MHKFELYRGAKETSERERDCNESNQAEPNRFESIFIGKYKLNCETPSDEYPFVSAFQICMDKSNRT